MKIGIDVDSGEHSFIELVEGALNSIQSFPDIHIYLLGKAERIINAFPGIGSMSGVYLVDASETILMDEVPVTAVKKKKESPIVIGMKMLKDNIIDVFFSPGNTGAIVVAAVLHLGVIPGIKKPAMATFFPRINGGETLILDIGANANASELNLFQNALLGVSYYKLLWNKLNPKIGLLNMGVELGKGSKILKKAFNQMRSLPSFIGNVEGYNVFDGSVDIVVCDGFTGNSVLKTAEAMKKYFTALLCRQKEEKKSGNSVGSIISGLFSRFAPDSDSFLGKIMPEYYGAAPLLGVNGIILVGHGMCSKMDLENAIKFSYKLWKFNYLNEIILSIKKIIKKD